MKSAFVVLTLEPRIRDNTFEDQASADRVGHAIEKRLDGAPLNGVDLQDVEYRPSERPLAADYVHLKAVGLDSSEHEALRAVIDQEIARLVKELAD
jgi:hypothetical protein